MTDQEPKITALKTVFFAAAREGVAKSAADAAEIVLDNPLLDEELAREAGHASVSVFATVQKSKVPPGQFYCWDENTVQIEAKRRVWCDGDDVTELTDRINTAAQKARGDIDVAITKRARWMLDGRAIGDVQDAIDEAIANREDADPTPAPARPSRERYPAPG